MRSGVIARIAGFAALALAAPLMASSDSPTPTGVRGVVLDATCLGPCSVDDPAPEPYRGEGLVITLRRLPGQDLVARLTPETARFSHRLSAGSYRVRADVNDPCWDGEARRAVVDRGRFTSLRLRVTNTCILRPGAERRVGY